MKQRSWPQDAYGSRNRKCKGHEAGTSSVCQRIERRLWSEFIKWEREERARWNNRVRPSDLYPELITWAAFLALCHPIQPKSQGGRYCYYTHFTMEVWGSVNPHRPNRWNSAPGWSAPIPSFPPLSLSSRGCGCLDRHLSAQRSLCVEDQASEGVWHKAILAWVQSAEKRNNLQTLMVCHGMMNSVKGPLTPPTREPKEWEEHRWELTIISSSKINFL